MKNINRNKIPKGLKILMFLLLLISIDAYIFSQPGPPPEHGQNGDQGAGGMAPLGEGLIFFLGSAAIYGIRKLRAERKKFN